MLVILARSLEAETLATAALRVEDAAERAQLARWPRRSSAAT